jgi:ribosomal protein S18 acetylase RimI-like enzyme
MPSIRKVEPAEYGDQLLAMFERNDDDPTHPRLVLADARCELWLAEEGGTPAGFVLCTTMLVTTAWRQAGPGDPIASTRGGVENLLVDAPYRRRGLGRALMETAEAHYRAAGLDGMRLGTGADNLVAQALYTSVGYRLVREYTRVRNGAEQARISMAKDFT